MFNRTKYKEYTQNNKAQVVGDILHSLPEYFSYEPTIEEYCQEARKPANVLFVASDKDIACGFVTLTPVNETTSEIMVMAVRPEKQKRGLGTGLLTCVEKYARSRDKTYIMLKIIGPSQNNDLARLSFDFFVNRDYCLLEEYENSIWAGYYCGIMIKKL